MRAEPVVHVVDDDEAVGRSIVFLLSVRSIPAVLHESASDFLAGLDPATAAGCILTDVRMPGMDGIALLRELRRRGASLPVVVMTGHADVALAVQAMKEGAMDFVEKPFDEAVLLPVLRAGLERDREQGEREARRAVLRERLRSLTPRESQVLALVAAGKPTKIIAYELGLSPRTVEVHRANLMAKMAAGNASELVTMYHEAAPLAG